MATLNAQQWEVAAHCGECLNVSLTEGNVTTSVLVQIIDQVFLFKKNERLSVLVVPLAIWI